jgi:hypothetical protein
MMVDTPSSGTLQRRVILLAFGFFSLFLAYNTAQLLQTAVNGSSGYTCLGLVYGWFSVSSLVAPYFIFRYGACCLLAPSGVAYVMMTASYLVPESSVFLLSSCMFVGVSAAFLWTSQGSYIGACAAAMAKSTGRAMTDCASELNATFYSIFACSGGVSAAFSYAFLSLAGPDSIKALFVVLTLCGCVGIALLALLAEPAAPHAAAMRLRAAAPAPPPDGEGDRARMVDGDGLAEERREPLPDGLPAAATAAPAAAETPTLLYMVREGGGGVCGRMRESERQRREERE